MANLTIRFRSRCLDRHTTFLMYLPENFEGAKTEYTERPTKTLFLLHGYIGDAGNWVPEYLSEKYNFAVVIPNGENSFWLDRKATGHDYCRFLGEELPDYVRKTFGLAKGKGDTYIMGLSMGGFGALHTAFAYPDVFGKTVGLSGAYIHNGVAKMKPGDAPGIANYEYYRECFGDPERLAESDNNPEVLIKKLKAAGKQIPEIYMACGTEDFLLKENREMDRFLTEQGVEHTYLESEGTHNMEFWSRYVEKFIPMLFK